MNTINRNLFAVGPVLAVGLLLLAPQVASADTVMLLMQSGPENSERMELLSGELSAAGHKPMITGASLEDSALMLGCQPETAACVSTVIETGGADAAVIVPQDTGNLTVHRDGVVTTEQINAGASDYDWKLALSKVYGLPAPVPPTAPVVGGAELPPPGGGGFSVSQVKTRSWIVLGSGVGASVLGLVLLNVASGKQDDVDNHPVDTAADLEALRSLESSGENFNLAGNLFVVAGGVATLAGVGLMVWDMKNGKESGPTVVPSASETSVGVSLRWSNF